MSIFIFCKSELSETHELNSACTDLDLVAAAEVGPEAEAVRGQRRQGGGLALKPCCRRRRRWRRAVPRRSPPFRLPIGRKILPRQRRRQILSPLVIIAAAAAGLFARAFRLELRHNLPLLFKSKFNIDQSEQFYLISAVVFILLKNL